MNIFKLSDDEREKLSYHVCDCMRRGEDPHSSVYPTLREALELAAGDSWLQFYLYKIPNGKYVLYTAEQILEWLKQEKEHQAGT